MTPAFAYGSLFEVMDYESDYVNDSLQEWWKRARCRLGGKEKHYLDTFVILVSWMLWKQRNARVFQNPNKQFTVPGSD
jgi:hypothetical protein